MVLDMGGRDHVLVRFRRARREAPRRLAAGIDRAARAPLPGSTCWL
jgi:hypothetical protein